MTAARNSSIAPSVVLHFIEGFAYEHVGFGRFCIQCNQTMVGIYYAGILV